MWYALASGAMRMFEEVQMHVALAEDLLAHGETAAVAEGVLVAIGLREGEAQVSVEIAMERMR